jgi:peptidoglycan-associated lipoprotein
MVTLAHTSARLLAAAGVGLLLVASGCGSKNNESAPPPPPPAPALITQIVSIEPSVVEPNQAFSATIYGVGFLEGATVKFGTVPQPKVRLEGMNTIKLASGPMAPGVYDVIVSNPGGGTATLRSGLTVKAAETGDCDFVRVNFDFDQSYVRSDASSELSKHTSCWQARTGTITVEGHCDARGTTEYNLALGSRRAESVKSHLTSKGVSSSRVKTVSYGEERPVANGSSESAWAQNRRADITSKD